jgi:hypothetical protein
MLNIFEVLTCFTYFLADQTDCSYVTVKKNFWPNSLPNGIEPERGSEMGCTYSMNTRADCSFNKAMSNAATSL